MILGIDLGTTNSLVAISRDGETRVILDGDSALIPSVVAYDEAGRVQAVGARAKTLKALDPERILYSVKRLMGKGRKDLEALSKDLPFDFSQSTDEMIRIQVGSRVLTPIEVSADILRRCKFIAENFLGQSVTKAVVTVPAYFNDAQRVATSIAGRLAGLEVVRIINEPTAAALAFGIDKKMSSALVAVYDFGGGTFDISLLKVTDGIFEVLATDGDTELGGDDLDAALGEWLLAKMGDRPRSSEDLTLFSSQVEQLKRLLTDESEVEFRIHWGGSVRWTGTIHRSDLNEAIQQVVERTFAICRRCLKAGNVSVDQISEVVMVGGSTRVPFVRDSAQIFFKRAPNVSVDPEQVVALGAAIQGSVLEGDQRETLLLDVVPLSLGLETLGGAVTKFIPRNTTIPCRATQAFTTSQDNQTGVELHVLQGERELASACRSLGRFKLLVPPMPAGTPKIFVDFVLDANGVLRVKAHDEKTKAEASLEVRPSFGLSDGEVERLLKEAATFAEKDLLERQLIEARNQAQTLIRATEKSLQSPLLGLDVRDSEEKKIRPILRALEQDLKSASLDVIRFRTQELDASTRSLAEQVMSAAVRQHVQNQRLESAG